MAWRGRWSIPHSSWPSLRAAARTRRGDLRPSQMNTSDQQSRMYTQRVSSRLCSCGAPEAGGQGQGQPAGRDLGPGALLPVSHQSHPRHQFHFGPLLMFHGELVVDLWQLQVAQAQAHLEQEVGLTRVGLGNTRPTHSSPWSGWPLRSSPQPTPLQTSLPVPQPPFQEILPAERLLNLPSLSGSLRIF